MKVWQIQKDNTCTLVERPLPAPGPDEVRVTVKAVGVNRADILQIKGMYPAPRGHDSSVPGLEYAGVIDAVGERVLQRKPGDRVMGLVPGGSYSEALVTHAREILTVQESMDFVTAASIPEAFLTAYRALFIEGGLQPGQWCLVRPASAAVGMAAVQLASVLGARVIGSSRTPDGLTAARELGLDATVAENDKLGAQLKEITGGAGVAVIMDMVGPDWTHLLDGLRGEGKLVLVGILGGARSDMNLAQLLMRRLTLQGMTMRSQPTERRMLMAQMFEDRLAPLFANGRLQPLPVQTFAFDAAADAHTHMLKHAFNGKRVLVLDH